MYLKKRSSVLPNKMTPLQVQKKPSREVIYNLQIAVNSI